MKKPELGGRLNLRLTKALLRFIKDYAIRHHTTATQLIIDYFTKLREQEKHERIEQI